ncbi:MAG: septal ring lytic transglycosylase RlpA family protein [Actinomycetota bacterium]
MILARAVAVGACLVLMTLSWAGAHHRVLFGKARYYSNELSGEGMACGGKYRPWKMVAAHRNLPCGKEIRVKNRRNGRVVTVMVQDRGPYGDKDFIVDVSRRAARQLGFISAGIARVKVTVLHDD